MRIKSFVKWVAPIGGVVVGTALLTAGWLIVACIVMLLSAFGIMRQVVAEH